MQEIRTKLEGGLRTKGFRKTSEIGRPLVSIITVVINGENYLEETIKSIISQTYDNIEYIIIDGGSTDGTMDIIKEYENYIDYLVSEPDDGIADAMNKGIRLASGEIIAHLHAGDRYIDSLVINKIVQSYIKYSWRWGIAGSIVVDEVSNEKHIRRAHDDYRVLLKKNIVPHQSTFIVKDIFDKHGLFKVEYKQAMDYEYWIRIAFKGGERYTVLPFNTTYFLAGGKSSNIFELFRYLRMLRKSMPEYGCNVSEINDWLFLLRFMASYVLYKLKENLRMNAPKFFEGK